MKRRPASETIRNTFASGSKFAKLFLAFLYNILCVCACVRVCVSVCACVCVCVCILMVICTALERFVVPSFK